MKLDSSKILQLVLGSAITTNQLPFTADWIDVDGVSVYAPGTATGLSNSTTQAVVIPAPSAGLFRSVDYFSVLNKDTVSATVTVSINDGGTLRPLISVALATGERLEYMKGTGFRTFFISGGIKTA